MSNILSYLANEFADIRNTIIYYVPVLLISFPVHELSHGFVAYRLGDNTAKNAGRLTLNPVKHLDLLGTILILLTGFGWAKPVPINPGNFKNRKEGMALTAIAGPVSNLLLAFVSIVALRLLSVTGIPTYFLYLLDYMAYLNIGLAIFNLIPINPLDGSRILALFLPDKIEFWLYAHEQYIMLLLFALLFFTNILTGPLNTLIENAYDNLWTLVSLIPV